MGKVCTLTCPCLAALLCRDCLRPVSETALRRCTAAKFNNGGSRLAVCAGRNITIFNALTMRFEATLQVPVSFGNCFCPVPAVMHEGSEVHNAPASMVPITLTALG